MINNFFLHNDRYFNTLVNKCNYFPCFFQYFFRIFLRSDYYLCGWPQNEFHFSDNIIFKFLSYIKKVQYIVVNIVILSDVPNFVVLHRLMAIIRFIILVTIKMKILILVVIIEDNCCEEIPKLLNKLGIDIAKKYRLKCPFIYYQDKILKII